MKNTDVKTQVLDITDWFIDNGYGGSISWEIFQDKITLYVKFGEFWEKVGELPNDGTWALPFDENTSREIDDFPGRNI